MNNRKTTRIIFDKDYYVLQAIINSDKFKKKLREFYQVFSTAGIPIPETGFPTVKDYHEWLHQASEKSLDYHEMLDDILLDFGVNNNGDNSKAIHQGLVWYMIFGYKISPTKPTYSIGTEISPDKTSALLKLTVFPFTTYEDVENDVKRYITLVKLELNESKIKKNKPWTTFERDFKVYEAFLKAKEDIKNGIQVNQEDKSKSPYITVIYYSEYEKIKQEYGYEDLDGRVREIVSRCKRYLGDLKLL